MTCSSPEINRPDRPEENPEPIEAASQVNDLAVSQAEAKNNFSSRPYSDIDWGMLALRSRIFHKDVQDKAAAALLRREQQNSDKNNHNE